MGLMRITALLALCVSSCMATYGNNYHHGKGSKNIHLDSPNIHLDSAKILVDRPRIHIKESSHGHGHIEDDVILGGGGKAIIGVHSTPRAVAPILISGGHGGYGAHGGYEGHGGKVFNVAGPIVVAPAPIHHHDGPILVRRPVSVHKELVPTQDHLEKQHYGGYIGGIQALNHGGYISGGHGGYALGSSHGYLGGGHSLGHGYIGGGHGGYIGGHALNHGGHAYGGQSHGGYGNGGYIQEKPLANVGHGIISFSAYHQPAAPVFVGQSIYGGAHGGKVHGGGLYGGGLAYGKDIHGGGGHGGDGGYKKY